MSKRRLARIIAVQALYQYAIAETDLEDLSTFFWVKKKENPHIQGILDFSKELIVGTLKNIETIDSYIDNYYDLKKQYKLTFMTKSILRVSIYSLFYQKNLNPIITINEAIIIAKQFAEDKSFTIINGILNSIIKNQSLLS